MKLFVAKLNRDVQDEHLVEAFSAFGEVAYARVITDRDTGQSKCFGFVQMRDEAAGKAAIDEMNGAELMGFRMVVKEAEERPRTQSPGGGHRPSRGSESSGENSRSPRATDSTEFSRQPGSPESPQRDFRKKSHVKKSNKPKGQRDIYADGPKPSKLKKSKPKNTDWLDDLDDY
ncbi:MAG: RNA recognition motif domain-containing protein [Flavobacteriales bacterium]